MGAFIEAIDLHKTYHIGKIEVPALRERENDVLLLAQAFLQRSHAKGDRSVVGFKSAAAERLLAYPWPGNVRELQNCIERAVALSQFDHIGVDDLPERIGRFKPTRTVTETVNASSILPIDEVERRYVEQVLETLGDNKASAARLLGMDRRTLYRKLERWASAANGAPHERLEGSIEGRGDAAF